MAKLRYWIVALLFVGFNCAFVISLQAQDEKKEEKKEEKRDVRDDIELWSRLAQTPIRPVAEVSL
ncbi:MAG: hypothetical protein LBH19_15310 [Dysgonamonadaceae bacterium]|jgi:hypothetical protein|nr:hypothetical protein [Dysgonamonadaceae bacterium]